MYLSVDSLIQRAARKKVDVTEYSKEELEELIEACQLFIEEQTGRIFERRTVTERFSRFSGTRLQLKYYPILSVESLKIDNTGIIWYLKDPDLGIILFDTPIYGEGPFNLNNIMVQYTTCPFLDDPDKVHPVARKLVADMCLQELLKSPDGQELASVKEGDLAETYTNVDWVDKQLNKLKRPIFATIPG
jgi:hypothetical protein